MPSKPASVLALASLLALTASARGASAADEPELESADSIKECNELADRNETELRKWEKEQPAVPYEHRREKLVLGAPWGRFFEGIGDGSKVVLATVLPHMGMQLREPGPQIMLAWPWSVVPFGPRVGCTRERGKFEVRHFRNHRLMVEPAVLLGDRRPDFFVRPGYRFVFHPTDWVAGVGGGIGTTADVVMKGEPMRMSVSPEVVVQFGHCCEPGFVTVAVRYDHYFAGNFRDTFSVSAGYTFF